VELKSDLPVRVRLSSQQTSNQALGFRGIRWVIPAETKLGGYFEAYRNLFGTALVVRSLDAGATIRAFCHTLSILALNFAAIAGLSSRYPVRVLLGNGCIARIRVGLSGSRSVTANSLTAPILDAISRNQTRSK
jgi:hypothetical protein